MVAADDIARMRAHLFFEGADVRTRLSRFWLLLLLAAIIATAGVGGDSTATVIGAMIVAPLMTPILGIVLAMVLNDRRNLLRSIAMVVAGACVVAAAYAHARSGYHYAFNRPFYGDKSVVIISFSWVAFIGLTFACLAAQPFIRPLPPRSGVASDRGGSVAA